MKYIVRVTPDLRPDYYTYLQRVMPYAIAIVDKEHAPMQTYWRALAEAGPEACCQFEDDVIPTVNFPAKAEAEIARRPGEIIQFFSRQKQDLVKGSRYLPMTAFWYTVGFYLPPGYAQAAAAFMPTWPELKANPGGMDVMLQALFHAERYWLVVPNLVDHRAGPSALVAVNGGRRAHNRCSLTFKEPEL